jgi:hypothetical protein
MNDAIIMLLSTVIVWHGIARLAGLPSFEDSKWKQRALSLSVWLEFAGALLAFGSAYTGRGHEATIIVLLSSIALVPFVDQRLARRVAWKKEST